MTDDKLIGIIEAAARTVLGVGSPFVRYPFVILLFVIWDLSLRCKRSWPVGLLPR